MKLRRFTPIRWVSTVAAIAALSLVGLAGPASADVAPGNIDPGTPSSLTIHKYDGDEGAHGDGTAIDESQLGNPLKGVEFTITPVTEKGGEAIDLDTAAGWNLIDGVTVDQVTEANGYTFGTKIVDTTDADGSLTKSLPHGLYLVTETGHGDNNIISDAEPFLVTLPLSQSNGGWLYDVHVYPKNKVNTSEPTKSVSDPKAPVLGSTVSWSISTDVPALAKGDTYKSFTITDALDPRLECTSITVAGFDTDDYTVDCQGQTAKVTFTPTGLGKLKAGDSIVTTVTTTVKSLGDGVIKNTAVVNTNGSEVTTNTPSTNWGALKVLKHADGNVAKTLANATFDVYADKNGSSVGTLTTNEKGEASITLWVGNNDDKTQTYWLKETAAPAGYTLPQDPWTEVTVTAGAETSAEVFKIANTQKPHGELPFTGADGQTLLTYAGIGLLLLAGGAAAVRYSRRQRQN